MASGLPLRHPAQGFNASQQLIKSDRGGMLTMSDDNVMMKQIVGTHAPDGREVDVTPLLHLVEDILKRATLQIDTTLTTSQAHAELDDKAQQINFVSMIDALTYTIDRISCEIAYKALSGTDAHATTLSIFNMLTSYSWDAKLVLTLAAFALNYGEFWLLAQIYSSNQLAKSMAILRQLPNIMEHSGSLKPRFKAINNLIKVMMDVARCVVEFKDLPSSYISNEVTALSTAIAHIPTAVYWTIRSVVACAAQITGLTTMGHEFSVSTTEAWELSTLAHKLNNVLEHLRKQLATCYQHIGLFMKRRSIETFQILINLFEMIHIDNMKVLKALIYPKDDIQPLIDGSSKKRVHLDVLRRKNVLLLISGPDISNDEFSILEQIYNESWQHGARLDSQYKVVWIPVVDHSVPWSKPRNDRFESIQSAMPWNRPILVVLDPQGKVVCPNALHMMWIWGSNAFPFTSSREESLWREETWRLELLVDGIDPVILNWIKEGKYIFLYGGDNIEWVRKFTKNARAVAQAAHVPLEMVYVGKSSKRDKIQRVMDIIVAEKLSYMWPDLTMIWFFWTRLESMLYSKIQLGKLDDHDPMMQEIMKLLSYDREGGWAVLSNGSNVVVSGHSTTVLPALIEYDLWKDQVPDKGFDLAFHDHHLKLHDISSLLPL
ncbi:PROTEIN SIEVE ELEMENT OCCLUSION A [Salix viminalis]|uniref:PROTEIN SIEVE ELEMENT OCCLUSION A n=1 Tax=Salix viminalis TaxID=40686 RepID=A0A9Q0NUY2_SALVM|nr:PROTEIN SIEVE ELEMENT OCCLUSION A [Salix viminalis]